MDHHIAVLAAGVASGIAALVIFWMAIRLVSGHRTMERQRIDVPFPSFARSRADELRASTDRTRSARSRARPADRASDPNMLRVHRRFDLHVEPDAVRVLHAPRSSRT